MKVALVCPANVMHMPYVRNYIKVLSKLSGLDFYTINWDRFGIEEKNINTYRDKKVGHKRGGVEYYIFSRFVKNRLAALQCDRVIVFGLQMMFFLNGYLQKKYAGRYLLDIRDHHRIIAAPGFSSLIEKSFSTIISSPGFREWLPKSGNYLVNHNTSLDFGRVLEQKEDCPTGFPIVISCVGALKDFEANREILDLLGNEEFCELRFNGEGVINDDLHAYIEEKNLKNVFVTGRYLPSEEASLYHDASMINMLMSNGSLNNRTCLSNRLYNAVFYGRPLLALSGSQISALIQQYDLGLVVPSLKSIKDVIEEFFEKREKEKYLVGRNSFSAKVMRENKIFEDKLRSFF